MVKGDAVQLSFAMCPHPEEATAKLVLASDTENLCPLSALSPCAYVFNSLLFS